MTPLLRLLIVLFFATTGTPAHAAAVANIDQAIDCVLRMAEEMQSLPQGNKAAYESFTKKHVHLEQVTARAMGRAWKNFPNKHTLWLQAALTETIEDTISTLKGIQIGELRRPTAKVVAPKKGDRYFIVVGTADGIEVQVQIDERCRVIEAIAGQVKASERIRDRINTMYPSDANL